MKNFQFFYLFINVIIVNSCYTGYTDESSKLTLVLKEVIAITSPTTDTTPDYVFSSNMVGSIEYGGSCSSNTTSTISGNNFITLNPLNEGTYSDCTITVGTTESGLISSLTMTTFTISGSGWELIAKQVDEDGFTDGTDEVFSSNARSTYLENENDSSSPTFMSIGSMTKSNYVSDGKYKFKLVWDGLEMSSEGIKEVTWTQTSWPEESTIQGFQEIEEGTSGYVNNSCSGFRGLGKSNSTWCVLDGNGAARCWYNCVGVITLWGGHSIPGPLEKRASSMLLYIWEP